jgi:hypothetical protein
MESIMNQWWSPLLEIRLFIVRPKLIKRWRNRRKCLSLHCRTRSLPRA